MEGFTESLLRAVEKKDTEFVSSLLETTAKLNQEERSDLGRPLLLAVECASEDIVEILLRYNASLHEIEENPDTLLRLLKHGNTEIIRRLICAGLDPNLKGKGLALSGSLLITAIIHGRDDLIELLLNCGVDADAVDFFEKTALHYAVEKNNSAVVVLLVNRGVKLDVEDIHGVYPLGIAIKQGNLHVTKSLIEAGADFSKIFDKDLNNIVQMALKTGDVEMIWYVMRSGAEINHSNIRRQCILDTCLTCMELGKLDPHTCHEMWLYLIDREVDFTMMRNSRYIEYNFYAYGTVALLKILLNNGLKIEEESDEENFVHPLHISIANSNTELFHHLVFVLGIDMETVDDGGNSALSRAARNLQIDMVHWLVKLGMNVDRENDDGLSVLQLTVRDNNVNDCFKFLVGKSSTRILQQTLDHCVDINKTNYVEWLVRHIALETQRKLNSDHEMFDFMRAPQSVRKYYQECINEIRDSKNRQVWGTIKVWSILTMSKHDKLGRSENLSKYFGKIHCATIYPIYTEILHNRFSENREYQKVIVKSMRHFGKRLGNELGSNKLLIDMIFQFLSEDDVANVLKV